MATDPSGLQEEGDFAGQDMGKYLVGSLDYMKNKYLALSLKDKVALYTSMYAVPSAFNAWDIAHFYKTEDFDVRPWTSGKYGKGKNARYVTVNGDSYFAGGVNYVFWGAMNKWMKDDFAKGKVVENIAFGIGRVQFTLGKESEILPHNVVKAMQNITLEESTKLMEKYRKARYWLGYSKELGIKERKAWTEAGWKGDFEIAKSVRLNDTIKPCPEQFTTGDILFRAGFRNPLEKEIRGNPADWILFEKVPRTVIKK